MGPGLRLTYLRLVIGLQGVHNLSHALWARTAFLFWAFDVGFRIPVFVWVMAAFSWGSDFKALGSEFGTGVLLGRRPDGLGQDPKKQQASTFLLSRAFSKGPFKDHINTRMLHSASQPKTSEFPNPCAWQVESQVTQNYATPK